MKFPRQGEGSDRLQPMIGYTLASCLTKPINLQGATMLYVDIPTLPEFKALATVRGNGCVSIYLPTTPLPQDTSVSRAQLKTFGKAALDQLDEAGFDKRQQASIGEHLAELEEDDEFWRFQAHSLAVLLTPETMRTFRLPNRLTAIVEVSDRFHLKPLLRAITFPHEAFVLALSENAVRLVHGPWDDFVDVDHQLLDGAESRRPRRIGKITRRPSLPPPTLEQSAHRPQFLRIDLVQDRPRRRR